MSLICGSINFVLKNNLKKILTKKTSIACLSQWNPQYMSPVLEVNRMEELEKSERLAEMAFRPIKARQSSHSCGLFYDDLLNRFISKAHLKGHKAMMRDFMRQCFAEIKTIQIDKYLNADQDIRSDIECNPLIIFHTALDNCRPLLINRPIRRGGATYQVPYPLKTKESEEMAMRWLIHAVRDRPKPRKTWFAESLAKELIDAYYNEGKVVKKKQDVHRVCEANRAYAHYRWG